MTGRDYATLEEARTWIKVADGDTREDELITNLITSASRSIDKYTNRFFYPLVDLYSYDPTEDTEDYRTLNLDADLYEPTQIVNGNGVEIELDEFILLPRNRTPKRAIQLKMSSSKIWTWQTSPEDSVIVTGTWGYLVDGQRPAEINLLCLQLVGYFYRKRDAPFNQVGLAVTGQAVSVGGLPEEVTDQLDLFRKWPIGG